MTARRSGIMGGTFDPIHLGHLIVAEQAREELRLDRVIFMPAAIPPHKRSAHISAGRVRIAMLELAGCSNPPFAISSLELERTGVSFTVDTLRQLRRDDPDDELFLIVGRDNMLDLPNWREPAQIAQLATVVVANRVDDSTQGRSAPLVVPAELAQFRIKTVDMPVVEISGRDIRSRVASGRSIRFLVPEAVERYILANKLYTPS